MNQTRSPPFTDDPDHPLDKPDDKPDNPPDNPTQPPPWRNPPEELPGDDGHDPDDDHPRNDKLHVD